MYIVGEFLRSEPLVNTDTFDKKWLCRMCNDNMSSMQNSYVIVKNHHDKYEYLKCDLIFTPTDDNINQHTKYVCGIKGVDPWQFLGNGIPCDKVIKQQELQQTLSAIMDNHHKDHNVGITISNGRVVLVDYVRQDLISFHYKEKAERGD